MQLVLMALARQTFSTVWTRTWSNWVTATLNCTVWDFISWINWHHLCLILLSFQTYCFVAIRFVLSDLFQNLRSEDRVALLHVCLVIIIYLFTFKTSWLIFSMPSVVTISKFPTSMHVLLDRKVQGTKLLLRLLRFCSIILTIVSRYCSNLEIFLFFKKGMLEGRWTW